MAFLAGGRVGDGVHETIVAGSLEVGDVGALLAEIVQLPDGQGTVLRDDVGCHQLAPDLVGDGSHDAVLDLRIHGEDGFHFRGIDVLSGGDDHLGFVVVVEIGRFGGGGEDDLADFEAVLGGQVVGFGAAAVVETDNPHVVIDTGSAGGTRAFRQVEGTEEGVPEGFRRAVAVEDVRGENLLVADAGRFFQGTAHRDDSLEGREVVCGLLLFVGQTAEDRRDTYEEGNTVPGDILERRLRIELREDHDGRAGVEGRAGARAVEAAAVEPGRGVHRHVAVVHREMDHHVVRGQDFVDARERNGLGMAGGAGCIQAGRLVIDIMDDVRFGLRSAFDEGRIGGGPPGSAVPDGQEDFRPMVGQAEGLFHGFPAGGAEQQRLRAGVVDAPGQFARTETEADRAADGARLVGGDIADGELRAVAQLHHQDISLPEAGVHQGVGEAVAFKVQFPISPAPSVGGRNHRGAVSVPPHVAHEALDPGIAGFEYLSEIFHFSVFEW